MFKVLINSCSLYRYGDLSLRIYLILGCLSKESNLLGLVLGVKKAKGQFFNVVYCKDKK